MRRRGRLHRLSVILLEVLAAVAAGMLVLGDEVHEVATDVTGTDREVGVATALARYFQG